MTASATYIRNAHCGDIFVPHAVFTVWICFASLNCKHPHLVFGWREDMAGIVTRVQCSQAGDPEGSDLVDHTLEGTPLQELFGFFGFPFFSPPSTMIF